ncbi:hypothetical protein N656DRAFT_783186 [Canariomyces notabilis]|uniref:Nephrocystin 3-like N-terminal domain-containing protein n=1 Tax=Canariomyces notabilis TaxID=2074819 RepID=A0AAN6QJI2_9PEZI|nr:hypothetical protein N656DRAFT_783186 [Canariomyces arenarius]
MVTKAHSTTYKGILSEEDRELEQATRQARLHAWTSLVSWLRDGEGIFHISGKAGSGKSTLIKFLLDHDQTRKELERCPNNDQLLLARFFFWRAGGKLQRSLEGLYRAILFEILTQIPHLVRDVFPDAYNAFSDSGSGVVIDEPYFRPRHLEKGMERLISKSPYPGYRICLVIDGLDEYGEDGNDSLQHELLVEQLLAWVARGGIKISA